LTGGAIAVIGSLFKKTTFEWSDIRKKITLVEMAQAEVSKHDQDEETLKKAFRFSLKGGGLMTLVLIIAWPMPLFFSGYVFDVGFYGLWVGIAVVWVSTATFFIVGLPLIEARHGIAKIARRQKAVEETTGV
jgi:urea-proton symporter